VERTVVGIDIGTTKIVTLVGQQHDQGVLRIVGVGNVPSRGIDKGSVVNVEEATNCIRASVREAERQSNLSITRAYVGMSSVHVAGVNSRGTTAVARPARGVTEEDTERALESAQNIAIPYSHEIVHTIPRSYTLDGHDNIRNPLGLYGQKLEVDAHLVTCAMAPQATLLKCVRAAGVEVIEFVFQALASGEAVLSPEERDSGVVLVDIGGGTTDVAVFLEGSVWHSGVVPRGGSRVTRDLSQLLQMPFQPAEEVKLRYGHAEPEEVSEGEMVEVAGFGDQPNRLISRLLISQIVEARIEQILLQVQEEIKRSGYSGLLPAGVVLCGGTAQLSGVRQLARRVLNRPVRIGTPQGIRGYLDEVAKPAFACSVGLLHWGLLYGNDSVSNGNGSRPGRFAGLLDLARRILPG
jgi:cell division protein FtsA